ncbi:hypothetical protein FRC02_011834 [Tulasnella sp. 418]|nr:hypothetical protein FRC02_011834 [Tulasnella sp. 418]
MQLASHHSSVFEIASPCGDQDQASRIVNQFDTAFNNNVPRVLYYNYYVGESKDLLFGVSLADYAAERGLVGGSGVPFESRNGATVPVIVKKCIKEIETRGLQAEGIYQESGQLTVLQELKSRVEKDEMAFEFNSRYHDVYCVASLLKLYFRELPEPVFRLPIQERLQHTEDRDEQIQAGFPVLRHKIKQLPLPNQVTLRTIIEHLSRIAAHNHQNATKARNLAMAIGTTLFGQDDLRHFSPGFRKDTVLEDMISFSGLLYDDKASTQPAAYSPHRNSPLDDPLRSPPADLNPPTKQNAVSPPRPFIKAQSTSPETNHLAVPQIRAPIPRPQRQSTQPLANGVSESKNRSFGKIPRISFITEELGATEQDPADNVVYPWQSGEHSEFEFLHAEVLFNPADFGLPWHDYQQLPHYRNQQFLIITSPDKATIFNLVTKTTREFKWPLPMPPDPLQLGCCIISPDGNTVIRKLPIVNQPVEAIDLKTRLSQSILPVQYAADAKDLLRAYWKGNAMLYLPVREKGLIIRWSLLEIDPVKAFQTLQVMDPITRHENIQVFVTSDEKCP